MARISEWVEDSAIQEARRKIRSQGRMIDSGEAIYVEAVRKAREAGVLYEGLDMAEARVRAKAEAFNREMRNKFFN